MFEHLDTDEMARLVHADQRDNGLARVGGGVGDVGREHHIAKQLAAFAGLVVSFNVGRLALAF